VRTAVALLTLYTVWGSTYLAIHYVVEAGWPLLLTAGIRFALAAGLFLLAARAEGPWRAASGGSAEGVRAVVAALLLFVVSNGLVMWGQTRVPSGLTALLVALTPLWITLVEAALGARPTVRQGVGGWWPACSAWRCWPSPAAASSIRGGRRPWSRRRSRGRSARSGPGAGPRWPRRPKAPAGSWRLRRWCSWARAAVRGERLPDTLALRPTLAFAWLLFGGSFVGFGAFSWLLRHTRPAVAVTYAYVNPIVAAGLGWAFAGESFGARAGVAGALVLGGVLAITTAQERRTT
jgi:drug/metabolite transporter (DMT)-like permease